MRITRSEVREKIEKYHTKNGVQSVCVNDTFIGNGTSEIITSSMQALLNKGDEKNGWNPDIADIEAKMTKKTHAIEVMNPNNPTIANFGGVFFVFNIAGDACYYVFCRNGSFPAFTFWNFVR